MRDRICIGSVAILLLGLVFVPGAFATGVAPDNGSGTVNLPPPLPYVAQTGTGLAIINGLPAGTTIAIAPRLDGYSGASEGAGGTLGGNIQTYNAVLHFSMTGTGTLAGFSRSLQAPVVVTTYSGFRTLGATPQSFDTDLFQLQGQIALGDADFDLLRITAGTGFGMPSPGVTTLTKMGGTDWLVNSFFDMTWRIDFIGNPGGAVAGMSGSTIGTTQIEAVPEPAALVTLPLLFLGVAASYRRRRA
jgi:hypothetical protein